MFGVAFNELSKPPSRMHKDFTCSKLTKDGRGDIMPFLGVGYIL